MVSSLSLIAMTEYAYPKRGCHKRYAITTLKDDNGTEYHCIRSNELTKIIGKKVRAYCCPYARLVEGIGGRGRKTVYVFGVDGLQWLKDQKANIDKKWAIDALISWALANGVNESLWATEGEAEAETEESSESESDSRVIATRSFVYPVTGAEIRQYTREDGVECFVAPDVCKSIGSNNVSQSVSVLDTDERGIIIVDTNRGPRRAAYVTEPGLYRLLASSRTDAARAFQRWVYHEVLPTIRKTGTYSMNTVRPQNDNMNMGQILEAFQTIGTLIQSQTIQIGMLAEHNAALTVKIDETAARSAKALELAEHALGRVTGRVGPLTLNQYIQRNDIKKRTPLHRRYLGAFLAHQYRLEYPGKEMESVPAPNGNYMINVYPREHLEKYDHYIRDYDEHFSKWRHVAERSHPELKGNKYGSAQPSLFS